MIDRTPPKRPFAEKEFRTRLLSKHLHRILFRFRVQLYRCVISYRKFGSVYVYLQVTGLWDGFAGDGLCVRLKRILPKRMFIMMPIMYAKSQSEKSGECSLEKNERDKCPYCFTEFISMCV